MGFVLTDPFVNQNPEQTVRDTIDSLLAAFGWTVQKENKINLHASVGVAVTEYITDAATLKFNEEQMQWLRMIKEHIALSIHLDIDDLDYTPFDKIGGRGKMWQLLGKEPTE